MISIRLPIRMARFPGYLFLWYVLRKLMNGYTELGQDMLTKMGVEMRAYFDLMKRIAVAYNNSTANGEVQE